MASYSTVREAVGERVGRGEALASATERSTPRSCSVLLAALRRGPAREGAQRRRCGQGASCGRTGGARLLSSLRACLLLTSAACARSASAS